MRRIATRVLKSSTKSHGRSAAVACKSRRFFSSNDNQPKWTESRPKDPPPKPKELKYREQMVDSEFYGAHANSAEMGGEDRPVTHKEIVDMLRDQDVIQSEKVYKLCWDINPHHFSAKPKEAEPGKRRAYEGFAEEEASYTAEEWAEAMVIFIGIMEQFSSFLKPGMKVLDIGSGTGYVTAALAHLVGPTGLVIAVETSQEMINHAQKVLSKHHPDLLQRIQFVHADGMRGYPSGAPFDAIHVEGAVRGGPRPKWIQQLRDGGILVGAFIERDEEQGVEVQTLRMMRKIEGSTFEQVDLTEVNFEELVSTDPAPKPKPKPESDFVEVVDELTETSAAKGQPFQ